MGVEREVAALLWGDADIAQLAAIGRVRPVADDRSTGLPPHTVQAAAAGAPTRAASASWTSTASSPLTSTHLSRSVTQLWLPACKHAVLALLQNFFFKKHRCAASSKQSCPATPHSSAAVYQPGQRAPAAAVQRPRVQGKNYCFNSDENLFLFSSVVLRWAGSGPAASVRCTRGLVP